MKRTTRPLCRQAVRIVITAFIGLEGNWESVEITSSEEEGVALLADPAVRRQWRDHYNGRKVLALLTEDEHKQLGKGRKGE
ncbi:MULTISPECIES: hypothetical protein [unclassified Kitasatospora]|uniref:hypothetical protein n=1 Tax=unclassified Kitasatospora TaxID=2633591 RepID=UPI00070C37E5|nr:MULTISPECIES: hypothetical protein [unclassified Kitasatospora]KQV20901.1 hypothetical protein ASC99_20570 [Kitasatospora sp. Root107]KRB60446.1 hypothetical protein ASE03_12615 [Kitasatospora sp. Root187]